jgi:hypothetical protein
LDEVLTVLRGTLKHPRPEPLLEGAAERIHAAVREPKEHGIVDEKGNRVRADRDFGGQAGLNRLKPGLNPP